MSEPPAISPPEVDAHSSDEQHLAYFIATHRPACPQCEVAITSWSQRKCGKCKAPLRLGMGSFEQRLLPWGICLMFTWMGTTLGIFACIGLAMIVAEGGPGGLAILMLYFISYIPLAIATALNRRRFVQLPTAMQWTCVALIVGWIGVFFLLAATL